MADSVAVDGSRGAGSTVGSRIVLAVCVAASAAMLWRMLVLAKVGIDFTDEGFYLVWIAQPWTYQQSVSQFGFVYHPLYKLLGSDVVLLRQANIVMTFGLSWAVCIAFFRATFQDRWPPGYWRSAPVVALAATMATTFPNLVGMWLPTPSYNTLALQAMLVAALGILLTGRDLSAASLAGWILIGVAGWLAFMAKPSSAAALAALTLVYCILAGKADFRWIGLSALTSVVLLVGSAWAIDGSVAGFLFRLQEGMALGKTVGIEQSWLRLLRLDGFSMGSTHLLGLVFLVVAFVAVTLAVADRNSRWKPAASLCMAVVTVAAFVLSVGWEGFSLTYQRHAGMLMWAAPISAAIAVMLLHRTRWAGEFSRSHLALAGCLLMLPHAYAFGTGNNYWQTAEAASVFWMLAGLSLLVAGTRPSAGWQIFLPTAVCARFVSAVLLLIAAQHPYRHPESLAKQAYPVRIGEGGSQLVMGREYAEYLEGIQRVAREAGFLPHTPMLDLTGHSPGTLYGLAARSTGQAWLIGGYPGSGRYAEAVLSRVACEELAAAWLLVEPQGPRKLPVNLLQLYGASMQGDFTEVGRVPTPRGFGGYESTGGQILLKPSRALSQAINACLMARLVAK